MIKEMVVQDLTEPMKTLKKCGIWFVHTDVHVSELCCATKFRQRPDLWPNDWILHNGNAPAHKVFCVKQFMAQKIDY
jgi:hypothetical protein